MVANGGVDAIKSYYKGCDAFLLVLSDGYSTHVTWTPDGTSNEFIITRETPSDGTETLPAHAESPSPLLDDAESFQVVKVAKVTQRVHRIYDDEDGNGSIDQASLIVPLSLASSPKEIVSVGRGGFNDIKLTSTSVSAIHASFIKNPDNTWGLIDRGSKNGSMMDGVMLAPNRLYPSIMPGREIVFADIKCIFLDVSGLVDACTA
jgi:hypothetical protein